jgi:hypothetical protein
MKARFLAGAAALAALLYAAGAQAVDEFSPVEPQPAAEALKQGLAVAYQDTMVRSVYEFYDDPDSDFEQGPPLTKLDYQAGNRDVLTYSRNDGVAARIVGFVHLPEPGKYLFAAESNDGVVIEINGKTIIKDPGVHADQFSENGRVNATAPGWYALKIHYFERKNTSLLRLYWQPPGADKMVIIPPEQLAYQ